MSAGQISRRNTPRAVPRFGPRLALATGYRLLPTGCFFSASPNHASQPQNSAGPTAAAHEQPDAETADNAAPQSAAPARTKHLPRKSSTLRRPAAQGSQVPRKPAASARRADCSSAQSSSSPARAACDTPVPETAAPRSCSLLCLPTVRAPDRAQPRGRHRAHLQDPSAKADAPAHAMPPQPPAPPPYNALCAPAARVAETTPCSRIDMSARR